MKLVIDIGLDRVDLEKCMAAESGKSTIYFVLLFINSNYSFYAIKFFQNIKF